MDISSECGLWITTPFNRDCYWLFGATNTPSSIGNSCTHTSLTITTLSNGVLWDGCGVYDSPTYVDSSSKGGIFITTPFNNASS